MPLLVALGLALGRVPALVRRDMPVSRILTVPGNSWFAWGPALVLLLAHDSNPEGRWGILLLALAAQLPAISPPTPCASTCSAASRCESWPGSSGRST